MLALLAAGVAIVAALWPLSGTERSVPRRAPLARGQAADGDIAEQVAPGTGELSPPEAEEEADLETAEPVFRFTVLSLRDGLPVAGARVCLGDGPSGATGTDGRLVLRGPARDKYPSYDVRAPGHVPLWGYFRGDATACVYLVPGARVTGVVLAAGSRVPIPGATIESHGDDPGTWDECRTDEEGRFEITAPLRQPFALDASAPGMVRTVVEMDAPQEGVEVVLPAGGTVRGTVAGCAGGTVRLDPVVEGASPALEADVKDGRYEIRGVPVGVDFVPEARCEGHRVRGEPVRFRDASEVLWRDLRFPGRVRLSVVVKAGDGRAVSYFTVRLGNRDKLQPPREGWPAGTCAFSVWPGTHSLSVDAPGWAERRDVVLTEGDDDEEAFVVGSGLAAEGVLVDPTCAPVLGTVYCDGWVETDASGRFRLCGFGDGPVDFEVWTSGFVRRRARALPGGPPVVVVLQPAATATVTWRCPGAEGSSEGLIAVGDDECYCSGDFFAEGEREVKELGKPLNLTLWAEGWPAPTTIRLAPLAAGEVRDLGEIRLDEGRVARATLEGPDGLPLVVAAVTVVEPGASWYAPRARSDERGAFCLPGLSHGPAWARVDAPGLPPHFVRLAEEAGPPTIRLTRGGFAGGAVGEAAYVTVTPALGHAIDPHAASVQATVVDGKFRVALAAGAYRAELQDGRWRPIVSAEFVVREGEATAVEFTPR